MFLEVFGEQMWTLCRAISVNFGVTVSNDFVPKHDMTSVTLSIQSEDILKTQVAVPYNLFQTKKSSSRCTWTKQLASDTFEHPKTLKFPG